MPKTFTAWIDIDNQGASANTSPAVIAMAGGFRTVTKAEDAIIMKAMITDMKDIILTEEHLPDGDFSFFGNGAMVLTIKTPGIPHRLMILENDGKVIAEGLFFKQIALNQVWHNAGDKITIKLAFT